MLLSCVLLAGPAAWPAMAAPQESAVAAPDLAPVKAWIAKSATIRTLIADFKQQRNLKTVRKPLESTGRVWIRVGGAFRWQVGDPPKLTAVLGSQGEFTVLNHGKKAAEIFSPEALAKDQTSQALTFLRVGFPTSLEAFQRQFEIIQVTPDGDWDRVELKPAAGAGSAGVVKMGMYLHRGRHTLGSMQVYLRDGSWIDTVFTSAQENPEIAAALFQPDLAGYSVRRK